jgi:hypothetical protein
VNADDLLMAPAILAELCPMSTNLSSMSAQIEDYIIRLVSHLIFLKGQSKIVRESIVAIADAAGSSASKNTVNTTDACRAIRSFTGIRIPDLTSFTRIPQNSVEINTSLPQMTPELSAVSPSMRGAGEDGLPVAVATLRKRTGSALADQIPPKVPKKRGRPRKNPLPEKA